MDIHNNSCEFIRVTIGDLDYGPTHQVQSSTTLYQMRFKGWQFKDQKGIITGHDPKFVSLHIQQTQSRRSR